jgi:hypothetical protein
MYIAVHTLQMNARCEVLMPMNVLYENIMHRAFSCSMPVKTTMAFEIITALWYHSPDRFVVTLPLCQDNVSDTLHFNVEVDACAKFALRFNGYWNKSFILCNIVCQSPDGFKETIWEKH